MWPLLFLFEFKRYIRNQGVDPDGRDGAFRYMEVVSRDESRGRFDMPVPCKNNQHLGKPLTRGEAKAITKFHSKLEETVGPVIRSLWKQDITHVGACGFLINQPGSSNQSWHRDGPNESGISRGCHCRGCRYCPAQLFESFAFLSSYPCPSFQANSTIPPW
jgi:hypothetical protein